MSSNPPVPPIPPVTLVYPVVVLLLAIIVASNPSNLSQVIVELSEFKQVKGPTTGTHLPNEQITLCDSVSEIVTDLKYISFIITSCVLLLI